MPIFGLGQKEELHVYETGYALAAEHGYQPYSSKKHIGKPVHASGFVAGFMYRVFVGNDPIWIRQSTMSSEFADAIEQGWTAGHTLEAQYKGHSYEANEDEPNDEFLSPTVQMFTGNLEQESWMPTFGYPGTFVSDCGRIRTWKGFRSPRLSPSHKYPHAVIPYGGNQPIHELVAETWIGLRPKKLYLCHNNDNKFDARLSNLRYDTPQANVIDRYKNRPR
jgi:hypothetical protein